MRKSTKRQPGTRSESNAREVNGVRGVPGSNEVRQRNEVNGNHIREANDVREVTGTNAANIVNGVTAINEVSEVSEVTEANEVIEVNEVSDLAGCHSDELEQAFAYIERGDLAGFRKHTEVTSLDLDARGVRSGETCLCYAARRGQHGIVRHLVQAGVNLERRANGNFTALHIAANFGHFKCCKLLVDAGASLDTQDDVYNSVPLISAVYWGFHNIVQLFCTKQDLAGGRVAKYGYGPLTLAAFRGHTRILRMLLTHGADMNERTTSGLTPLLAACAQGHAEIAELFLAHGACVNSRNNRCETALHCAAGFGSCEVVLLLLQKGADADAQNIAGATALHMACSRGHTEVAKLLLAHGANPNVQDEAMRTAVHCAALRSNIALVTALLQHQANIDLMDAEGKTGLDILSGREPFRFQWRDPAIWTTGTNTPRKQQHKHLLPVRGSESNLCIKPSQEHTMQCRTYVNSFMQICKRQFPLLRGFFPVGNRCENFLPQNEGFMQFIPKDSEQIQWLLVSTMNCKRDEMEVYDALCKSQVHSHSIQCKIASLVKQSDTQRGALHIRVMDVKQTFLCKEATIYVMAYATDLLHGVDPTTAVYADIFAIRSHLNGCFRTRTLTPFPKIATPRENAVKHQLPRTTLPMIYGYHMTAAQDTSEPKEASKIKHTYTIELHCICHMPQDNSMVKCDGCYQFFHPNCVYGCLPIETSCKPVCFECSPKNQSHLLLMHQPNVNNPNLKYDLYVSYSSEDRTFIRRTLLRHLDRRDGNGCYNLMVSERDWPAGGIMVDTIAEKLTQSVKAVAVLSRGFMERSARHTQLEWQLLVQHKPTTTALILLEPPETLDLSSGGGGYLRRLLSSGLYLQWSDHPEARQEFWLKLKRFLGTPLHQMRLQLM